mmetsp:Transcript_15009/g.30964  ORF Transcript_15009/g.30964 Transcript_15009/m.30964 type:complete len:82 (+) Transcript_15009:414-659(+)
MRDCSFGFDLPKMNCPDSSSERIKIESKSTPSESEMESMLSIAQSRSILHWEQHFSDCFQTTYEIRVEYVRSINSLKNKIL